MKELFLISTFFFCMNLSSQNHIVIEPAILECHYIHLKMKDTLTRETSSEDLMILRIGNNSSQFFSFYTHRADSMINDPGGSKLWGSMMVEAIRKRDYESMPKSRTTNDYIYKNHPENKLTTYTSLLTEPIIIEEEYERQDWMLTDSVKQVLGYECQQAKCFFRGRSYCAWFTPEIASNNGPWKFNGLPGLIMEVYDKDNHYRYEIVGIQTTGLLPVTLFKFGEGKPEKMDRLQSLKAKRKTMGLSFSQSMRMVTGLEIKSDNNAVSNPKKFKYDFKETDYH